MTLVRTALASVGIAKRPSTRRGNSLAFPVVDGRGRIVSPAPRHEYVERPPPLIFFASHYVFVPDIFASRPLITSHVV